MNRRLQIASLFLPSSNSSNLELHLATAANDKKLIRVTTSRMLTQGLMVVVVSAAGLQETKTHHLRNDRIDRLVSL